MGEQTPTPYDFTRLLLEQCDVAAIARDLLASDGTRRDGRAARTLARSPQLTVVITAVPAGGRIGEHAASGPVLIVPVFGRLHVQDGAAAARVVSAGEILCLGAGQPHRVGADEDSAFLLVIGQQS